MDSRQDKQDAGSTAPVSPIKGMRSLSYHQEIPV